tara:strand:- start:1183 stop:1872 length:690 start_codon:yes stop_codon:yes gene_type:complete
MVESKRRRNKSFSCKKDYIDKDGWHIKGGGNNPYRAKRKFIYKAKQQSLINQNNAEHNTQNNAKNSNIDNILSSSVFDTLKDIDEPVVNKDKDKDKKKLLRTNDITNKQSKSRSAVDPDTLYQLTFPVLSSRRIQTPQTTQTTQTLQTENTSMSWANIIKKTSNSDNTSNDNTSNENTNKKFKKPIREKNTKANKRKKKKELEEQMKQELREKKRQEIINNISQSKKQD